MTECAHPFPNSVHLTVADVKKTIKFYRDKLGFELRECYPNDKKPVWASLTLANQSIMVGACCTPEGAKEMGMAKEEIDLVKKDAKAFAQKPHGVGVQLYLCVEDVDGYAKAARKKKIPFVTALKSQFYGIRDFSICDPDGYRVVFYQTIACAMEPKTDSAPETCAVAAPAPTDGAQAAAGC